jgi:hypothetical protein
VEVFVHRLCPPGSCLICKDAQPKIPCNPTRSHLHGLLTPEQYFDFGLTIVEAADDPELREVFRQTILNWLQLNFSQIADARARKAHPKIMSWFHSETEARARRKDEEGDLEALVRTLNAP